MKNLYKIEFTHYSPKDSESGTKNLLLAQNDEQVYEWIKTAEGIYNSWGDDEKVTYDEIEEIFKDEYGGEVSGWWKDGKPELFKERMMRLKGEINDEDYQVEDAYYGVTVWGWEILLENVDVDNYQDLIQKEFIKTIK